MRGLGDHRLHDRAVEQPVVRAVHQVPQAVAGDRRGDARVPVEPVEAQQALRHHQSPREQVAHDGEAGVLDLGVRMPVARRAPAPQPLLRVSLLERRARARHVPAPGAAAVAARAEVSGATSGRRTGRVVSELALTRAVVGAIVVEDEGASAVAIEEAAGLLDGDAGVDQVVEQQRPEGADVVRSGGAEEARERRARG